MDPISKLWFLSQEDASGHADGGGVGRDRNQHNGIGAYDRAAPHGNRPQQLGADGNNNIVFHARMAIAWDRPAPIAQANTLVNLNVAANDTLAANDDSNRMNNHKVFTND